MHQRVRREYWGYAPNETFLGDDLIAEKYDGIRPAPGYPAQPDHTEKATLFRILDATEKAGVTLTQSFAMRKFCLRSLFQSSRQCIFWCR